MTTATLGGSTLPSACGLDPFRSPIRLWLELTKDRDRPETEAMWWGKRDQSAIIDRLRVLGYAAEEIDGATWTDPARPWLVGHPDGLLARGSASLPVECKSMAHRIDALDVAHEAQLQTYTHLSNAPAGLLARRIGHTLEVREVPRSQHAIDLLLELGARFLEHVERREPPPVSGHPDDRHALGELYPHAEPDTRRRETRAVREARRELVRLVNADKARKAREEHLRAIITEHLGAAEVLLDRESTVVATWKNTTARRFDLDAFKRDHPALYEEYRATSTTRVLRFP